MTFELDAATAGRQDAARQFARDAGETAARALDAGAGISQTVRQQLMAILPAHPIEALLDWVVVLEEVAVVSPAVALVGAADVLGLSAITTAVTWSGCRGVALEGLRGAGGEAWHLAVTAIVVGGVRGAVEAGVNALRAARAAGQPNDAAQPGIADAATALEASRLLLWNAATRAARDTTEADRDLARLHALDSVGVAWRAVVPAVGAEALRAESALDRVRRDLDAVVLVLGDERRARDAAAGAR